MNVRISTSVNYSDHTSMKRTDAEKDISRIPRLS